jgi:hypothetical protein
MHATAQQGKGKQNQQKFNDRNIFANIDSYIKENILIDFPLTFFTFGVIRRRFFFFFFFHHDLDFSTFPYSIVSRFGSTLLIG